MRERTLLVVSAGERFPGGVADVVDADVRSVHPASVGGFDPDDADCVVCDDTLGDPVAAVEELREGDAHLPVVMVGGATTGRAAAAADARWVPETGWEEMLPRRIERAVARYRETRAAREAETWFDAITDDAPYATFVLDSTETVRYVSPAVADLLGYDPDELVGGTVDRIIPETFQERHESAVERFMETGARHLDWSGVSLVARHASGEDVPVDVSLGTTVRDGERYFAAILRPEDRPAEESARFRKHEAFSESVFENTSDVILLADPDTGAVIDANPAAGDVLGHDYRSLTDTALSGLFIGGDLPDPGEGERSPVTARTADGGERVLEVSVATLTYEGETAWLVSGRDVTERRRREAELERQNERLEEFASIVSHDLRNPLNLAAANADLVKNGHEDRIEIVEEALEDMEQLIDDLLSLARQGEVVSESDFETFGLADAAEEAWAGVSPPDGAAIELADNPDIRGDRARVEQALSNLFRNAVEHAGPDVTVTVGALDDAGFSIADDGPGIPEDEREVVLDAGYTNADSGTGYGLAIVAEIAEAHGWEFSVAESESGGARFEFRDVERV